MPDYETRKCAFCGKEFEPQYAQHVCCSKECQDRRKTELGILAKRRFRESQKEKMQSLMDKTAQLERELRHVQDVNAELAKQLEAIKAQIKSGNPPKPETLQMEQCLRSNVRALHLPCGKNILCWGKKPCERCLGMTKPDISRLGGTIDVNPNPNANNTL